MYLFAGQWNEHCSLTDKYKDFSISSRWEESEVLFLDKNMLYSKIAILHYSFKVVLFGRLYIFIDLLYFVGAAFLCVNVRTT